jgi:hypothetical protein
VAEPVVHFGSFDAELAWRPATLATLPSAPFVRSTMGMDHLLAVAGRADDLLLTTEDRPSALADALARVGLGHRSRVVSGPDGQPVESRLAAMSPGWLPEVEGWSASAFSVQPATAEALARLGLPTPVPAVDVVARVNSKVWSNEFVLGHGLAGGAVVARTPDEVRGAIEQLGGRAAVIKDPYGVSGRGALRVDTPRTVDTIVRHLTAQTRRGCRVELLVQPLMDVSMDFSSHVEVSPEGDIAWLGMQTVENHRFAYLGSGPVPPGLVERLGDRHRQRVVEVAGALAAAGYFGPACIDGMLLDSGDVVPVLEVNARRSMGWLNLRLDGLAQRIGLRSSLRWYLVDPPTGPDWVTQLVERLDRAGILLATDRAGVLPLAVSPPRGRARCFGAVFARDADERSRLERDFAQFLRVCAPGRGGPTGSTRPSGSTMTAGQR